MASVWMDNKPVTMLSTLAQADVTHTIQRKEKDGSRISVQCSDAAVQPGVDKGDQLRQYYRVRMKCRKNYKCFCLMLLSPIVIFYLYSLPPPCLSVTNT